MKTSTIFSTAIFATSTLALLLLKRDSPNSLSVPFMRERKDKTFTLRSRKQPSSDVEVTAHSSAFVYWANVTIGTPPVTILAEVDTGSADVVVLTNQVCGKSYSFCQGGSIDQTISSTWIWLDEKVNDATIPHSSWSGAYATDNFGISGVSLKDLKFIGVTEYAGDEDNIRNILGIGLPASERSTKSYSNLPSALAKAGYINTPAYSMYLEDESKGLFLFGAVDKSKHDEPLLTLKMSLDNDMINPHLAAESFYIDRPLLVLTSFGSSIDGKSSNYNFTARPAALDSSVAYSQLSADMVQHLANALEMDFDQSSASYVLPCDTSKDQTVDFAFSELVINIPITDLLHPLKSPNMGINNKQYCSLPYDPAATEIILGDDFLRNTYLVYDQSNLEIAMAKINRDGGQEDIYEITDDIPGAREATDLPTSYLPFSSEADAAPTKVPNGVQEVTLTTISATATGTDDSGEGQDDDSAGMQNSPHVFVTLVITAFIIEIFF